MKELKNDKFRDYYIKNKCRELLEVDIDKKDITFIDEGVMNFVYKVITPKGNFYFKQALKKAKHHERIGKDLSSISYLRINYEKNVIDKIQGLFKNKIKLPNIIYYDDKNNIIILTDVAGGKSKILQNVLLLGDFNNKTALNIGKFLGILHRHTYNKRNVIRGSPEEDMKNWKVFLKMRTKGIISERIKKPVVYELYNLFNVGLKKHTYDILIHMDCCPKNIFQRSDNSIGIIDFELASGMGDPAYDIGFALGHYFLFAILKEIPESSLSAIQLMIDSYIEEINHLKFNNTYFLCRMVKYAGAVLLYRIAGSSPALYIPKEKFSDLIRYGSQLVISDCSKTKDIFSIF